MTSARKTATYPNVVLSSPAIMPDWFETRSMAPSARMNRAAQVVTLTFRSLGALHSLRQRRHDGAPLAIAHRRPAGDLIDDAAAADAQPCPGVEQANVDARRFQGSAGRLSRRLCRDWGSQRPALEAEQSTEGQERPSLLRLRLAWREDPRRIGPN